MIGGGRSITKYTLKHKVNPNHNICMDCMDCHHFKIFNKKNKSKKSKK